jgi:hypothetical protein
MQQLPLIAEAPQHPHPLGPVHVGKCLVTTNFLLTQQPLPSKLPTHLT